MDEMKNTSAEGLQTDTEGRQAERTFTQDDVNRIVQDRLAKEKGKNSEELDRRAAELDLRERKMNAVQTLRDNGLPDYLVDALNMETEEAFQKSMDAVKKMKGETAGAGKGNSQGIEPGTVILGKGDPIGVIRRGSDTDLRDAFGLG